MLETQKIDPNALLLANPMAAPAAGSQVPGGPAVAVGTDGTAGVLPYQSVTQKDPSTDSHHSTTQVEETPAMVEASSGVDKAIDSRIAAQNAKVGADVTLEAIGSKGADEEAQIRQDMLKRQQESAAAWDKKIAAIMSEREAARQDRDKFKPTTYMEDMSMGRRFLTALSLGMGTYGSIVGGGPNTAMDVYKNHESAFERKQNAIIEKKANAVLEKTGDINAAREQAAKDKAVILDEQIMRIDTLKARVQAQMKRVPQAATAGQEAIAQLEQIKAEKKLEQAKLLAPHTDTGSVTHGAERSVTDVTGEKSASGGQPQRETVNELVASRQQAKLLGEFEQIVKQNPKAWVAFRDATKAADETAVGKEGGFGGAIKAGQFFGALPLGVDQRIEKISDPKVRAAAKRMNQIFPIIQTGEARILDPVGVLNEGSQLAAKKHLNMYTMTPDEAVALSAQFRSQHEDKAALLGAGSTMQRTEAAAKRPQAAPAATSGRPRLTPDQAADFKAAQDALRKDPNNPKAIRLLKAVRAAVAAQAAGGAP